MSIQIPESAVQSVVAQAILESITPEVREKILSDAIATLILTPPKPANSYSAPPPKAPLQEAFDNAVRGAVMKQAHELVESSPEAQAAIKKHVGESIAALCEDNYEGLPELIGETIGTWLRDRTRR